MKRAWAREMKKVGGAGKGRRTAGEIPMQNTKDRKGEEGKEGRH